MQTIGPVAQSERISSVDLLRGFALLGILLMNIVGFGLYGAAYDDPTVDGGATGVNLAVWTVMRVLAEGKMRCLFSMVFGASIILLTSRGEERGAAVADIYYRRTLWLMVFGIAHAFLLWQGEVLYPYALCGLALYPFRKMRPRNLLLIGSALILLNAGGVVFEGFQSQRTERNAHAAEQAVKEGKKPTDEQKEAKDAWDERTKRAKPDAEALKKNAEQWRGSVGQVLKARAKRVSRWHNEAYYSPNMWDMWCMMFIGMGLLKLRILDASRPLGFYARLAAVGYAIGIPVDAYSAWQHIHTHFELTSRPFVYITYDLGRLAVATGHMGVLLMLAKSNPFR